jgi:glycerate 2-kinase
LTNNSETEDTLGFTRIVLAPDKFKGSLSAEEAVAAMIRGCADVGVAEAAVPLAIADGGDGSVDAALRSGWTEQRVPSVDAWCRPVTARVAVKDEKAIIEVATICGLGGARPTPADALAATSVGVGVVIRTLLDDGFLNITVGLGGSATTDGGAGMLTVLGVRLLDASGSPVGVGGGALSSVTHVDISGLDPRLANTQMTMACDVDSPMVGPDGSAEVFGPQKGADDSGVRLLSLALRHLAGAVEPTLRRVGLHRAPGSGAAGGLAWAGMLIGAELRSGAELFLDMLSARDVLADADLVLTGEGSLDSQSLRGKGPVMVARLAADLGVPALAIVGTNRLDQADGNGPFADVVAIDQIDHRCAEDPALTAHLVRHAVAKSLDRFAPDQHIEFEGAR